MREKAVSLAQWASAGNGPTPIRAARHAHGASARASPPHEREHLGGALACAHRRTPPARVRLRLAHQSAFVRRGRRPSLLRSALPWGTDQLQSVRRGTRTPQARVLRLLPRESTRWRARGCAQANAGCLLESAAGTSERGRAPREKAVPLAQCTSIRHGPTPISAARHAHAASARAAPPSEREHTVARSRVRAGERRLLVEGRI